MSEYAANLLIRKIEADRAWPPPFDHDAIGRVARLAAFRESDEDALRHVHGWNPDRGYVIDPLAERIAQAKADLLFGEDPRVLAVADADRAAKNLERILEGNDLPSELHYAEQVRSSEGEVWYRLMVDRSTVDFPLVTFHSREQVVPLYIGSALVAAAFVSEFDEPESTSRLPQPDVWRLLEIQSEGRIENRLYQGTRNRLGEFRGLDDFSETEDLAPVTETQIPEILCGRVVNRRGRERRLGKSDYSGVENLLLALNEAMTIGVENARLVAKRRVVVPRSALEQRPKGMPGSVDAGDGSRTIAKGATIDAGEDVLVAGPDLDSTLGKEDKGESLFKVLEYRFDAEALIAWQDALVKTVASRCGLTVAFLGIGDDLAGNAATGTALRVRLLPATSTARGSGRAWDDHLPRILMLAQLLDAMPAARGGIGRTWAKPGEAPSVERQDPLPRDETEETQRHVAAVGGPVESTRTAVAALHDDWSDEQIDAEVEAIRGDVQTANRLLGLGIPPGTEEVEPADLPPAPGEVG